MCSSDLARVADPVAVGVGLGGVRVRRAVVAVVVAVGIDRVADAVVVHVGRDHVVPGLTGEGVAVVFEARELFDQPAIAEPPGYGQRMAEEIGGVSPTEPLVREHFDGKGGLLLAFYSLGLAVPFLLTAVAFTRMTGAFALVRRHYRAIMATGGAILVVMGMLIWTELPNGGMATDRSRGRKEKLLKGIVDRDCNHPSIVIWTIINEDWGTRLTENPEHRQWLVEQYDWLKAYEPTRLAVDNSACFPNFHVKTDIEDYHYYRGIPDRRHEWDELTDSFAKRTGWTFSPYGDAQPRGDEPLVCSEFGIWGLPNPRDLRRGARVATRASTSAKMVRSWACGDRTLVAHSAHSRRGRCRRP